MKNSLSVEDIVDETPIAVQPHRSTPMPEADAVSAPKRRRRSVISRIALRLAPLYGSLYDWQMAHGGGVQVVRHRLQLPEFSSGAPSLRMVYLSDLHYGPTTGRTAPRQAWQQARDA